MHAVRGTGHAPLLGMLALHAAKAVLRVVRCGRTAASHLAGLGPVKGPDATGGRAHGRKTLQTRTSRSHAPLPVTRAATPLPSAHEVK